MNKRTVKFISVSLIAFGSLFHINYNTSLAQNTPQSPASYQTSVSSISLSKSTYMQGETVSGSFNLINSGSGNVSDLYYRVMIVGGYEKNGITSKNTYGQSSYQGPISIGGNKKETIRFSYVLPSNVGGKDVGIKIQLLTKQGQLLYWTGARFEVAGSMSTMIIQNASIGIGGKFYMPQSGPTIHEGEKPSIVVGLLNPLATSVSLTPKIKIYNRVTTGDPLYTNDATTTFVISAKAKKTVSYLLPLFDNKPAVYAGTVDFVDSNGVSRSPTVDFRYIIGGDIATIQSVDTGSGVAVKGQSVKVSVLYSGSPYDTRIATSTKVGSSTLSVSLFNEKGVSVGQNTVEINIKDIQTQVVPVVALVNARALRADVVIDKDGKTLSSFSTSFVPALDKLPQVSVFDSNLSVSNQNKIIIVVFVVLLLAFVGWFIIKRKKKPLSFLFLIFVVAGFSLWGVSSFSVVKADQVCVETVPNAPKICGPSSLYTNQAGTFDITFPTGSDIKYGIDFDCHTGICKDQVTSIPNDYKAYWKMDGNLNDEKGNNGTCTNCPTPTTDRNGNANSAYYFDGVNDYFEVGPTDLDGAPIFISFWIKPENTVSTETVRLFSTPSGFTNSFVVSYNPLKKRIELSRGGLYGEWYKFDGYKLDTETWNHVVIGYKYTGGVSYEQEYDGYIYVNSGDNDGGAFTNDKFTYLSPGSFRFGAKQDNTKYFKGSLDDIVIYRRVLDENEIMRLFNYNNNDGIITRWIPSTSDYVSGSSPQKILWGWYEIGNKILAVRAKKSDNSYSNWQLFPVSVSQGVMSGGPGGWVLTTNSEIIEEEGPVWGPVAISPHDVTVIVNPDRTEIQPGEQFSLIFNVKAFQCSNHIASTTIKIKSIEGDASFTPQTFNSGIGIGAEGCIQLGCGLIDNTGISGTFNEYDVFAGNYFAPMIAGEYKINFEVSGQSWTGSYGSIEGYIVITVVGPSQVPTVTLTANPSTISANDLSTLQWYSTDATSCNASWNESDIQTNGSNSVYPNVTTDYTVTCTGPGGLASDTITIVVKCGGALPTGSQCQSEITPYIGSWEHVTEQDDCPSFTKSCQFMCPTTSPWDEESKKCKNSKPPSCKPKKYGADATFAKVGEQVTWTASSTGKLYQWSEISENGPFGPGSSNLEYSTRYSTIGNKKVWLRVDGDSPTSCPDVDVLSNGLPVINNPSFQTF